MKRYIDDKERRYFVKSGINVKKFKTFYSKGLKPLSRDFRDVPWRKSFDAAQADLNAYAKSKGWAEVEDKNV